MLGLKQTAEAMQLDIYVQYGRHISSEAYAHNVNVYQCF